MYEALDHKEDFYSFFDKTKEIMLLLGKPVKREYIITKRKKQIISRNIIQI